MRNLYFSKINRVIFQIIFYGTPIVFISCTDSFETERISMEIDLSQDVLKVEEILKITEDLGKIQANIESKRINEKDAEVKIKTILEPLVDNGKYLHSKMINSLERSGEISKLSVDESFEIYNLNERQLAELSFITSYAYNVSIDPKIRACLSTAVGITAIYDLIANTAALGRVQTTMGALRLIGRRYLGWVGVGLMIVDFTECFYEL